MESVQCIRQAVTMRKLKISSATVQKGERAVNSEVTITSLEGVAHSGSFGGTSDTNLH